MERRHKYLDDPGCENDTRPDRSKTDFYCQVCDAHMYSEETWEAHVTGKRHLKNVKKAPGEMPSKIRALRVSKRAQLMEFIREIKEPVVGLSFMTELERCDPCLKPSYTCHLCQANLTRSVVIDHILDTKHRVAYIKAVDYERYNQMVSLQLSKDNFDILVEDQAAVHEKEHGQGTMEVKLEKPKMVLPAPVPRNVFFDPMRQSPSPSSWSRTVPKVSPDRCSRRRKSPERHSLRGSPERHSLRGSPERHSSRRFSSDRYSCRTRYPSPSGSVYSRTSHKQKKYLSPKYRRYSRESRSPSPRGYCSACSMPHETESSSNLEKIKLLKKLKIARLVVKGQLSRLQGELDPYLKEIFND